VGFTSFVLGCLERVGIVVVLVTAMTHSANVMASIVLENDDTTSKCAKEENDPPYVPNSERDYVFDSECRSYHLDEFN
ncbi:hypothetical protein L195_g056291, partial [Trifolium pratense]